MKINNERPLAKMGSRDLTEEVLTPRRPCRVQIRLEERDLARTGKAFLHPGNSSANESQSKLSQ